MPVLYYKADTSKTLHDPDLLVEQKNIYDYRDNIELIDLGLPWDPPVGNTPAHPMATAGNTPDGFAADKTMFYKITRDEKIFAIDRPMKPESYILISAGFDGQYGTDDDIFNFGE